MKINRAIIIVSALAFLPAPYAVAEKEYSPIQTQAAQGDVFARDLVSWLNAIRNDTPVFNTIRSVLIAHPDWPLQGELRVKADRAIVTGQVSDIDILKWYTSYDPVLDSAKLRHLEALARQDKGQNFLNFVKKYWHEGAFDTQEQAIVLRQWGQFLSQDDYKRRAENLIDQGKFARAEVAMSYLHEMHDKNLLATRVLLLTKGDGAEAAYQSLTAAQKQMPDMLFARLNYLREAKNNTAAMAFLAQNRLAPAGYEKQWWRERHILARRALQEKRYEDAYDLAADHGFEEGVSMAEGEWLCGWVALTYLNRPDLAFGHFNTMYQKVKTPISRARASYGAGLASEALKEAEIATRWFEVSGEHFQTFYGQKSLEKLGKKDAVLKTAFAQKSMAENLNEIVPSAGAIRRFKDMSAFKAAEYLHNAGYEKERDLFLKSLVWKIGNQDDLLDFLNMTQAMNSQTVALSVAKRLQQQGFEDWSALFPTLDFDTDPAVDPALTHAIIRQESVFNPNIESRAGAMGLMQLMPATAKAEAARLGITHDTAWLFSKPEHNVRLGQSYLNRMLDRYDGSLPLAIAAYNAGPGNVDEWLMTIGDPRQTGNDLEWMENIPFKETRSYVQRVLENYTIYQNKNN